MNHAQLERFDQFFDDHWQPILVELTARHPDDGLRRARRAFATAYRFWGRVEDDGDPIGWISADAERQRPQRARRPANPAAAAVAERRHIVASARRAKLTTAFAVTAAIAASLGVEIWAVR